MFLARNSNSSISPFFSLYELASHLKMPDSYPKGWDGCVGDQEASTLRPERQRSCWGPICLCWLWVASNPGLQSPFTKRFCENPCPKASWNQTLAYRLFLSAPNLVILLRKRDCGFFYLMWFILYHINNNNLHKALPQTEENLYIKINKN